MLHHPLPTFHPSSMVPIAQTITNGIVNLNRLTWNGETISSVHLSMLLTPFVFLFLFCTLHRRECTVKWAMRSFWLWMHPFELNETNDDGKQNWMKYGKSVSWKYMQMGIMDAFDGCWRVETHSNKKKPIGEIDYQLNYFIFIAIFYARFLWGGGVSVVLAPFRHPFTS